MLSLLDLQMAFAGCLGDREDDRLLDAIAGDSISGRARLRIHRNHVCRSLAAALAVTFPTVVTLVGPGFFETMAKAFVVDELPRQPVLAEYGARFPAFVDAFVQAHDLPYLSDVARLDWALNHALHAGAGRRLVVTDLEGVPPECLGELALDLAAGTTLMRSAFPLDRIWRVCQPDAGDAEVDLWAGGLWLLVIRQDDEAGFVPLDAAEAVFVTEMDSGATLGQAALAGLQASATFDLTASFGRLLALGAFGWRRDDEGRSGGCRPGFLKAPRAAEESGLTQPSAKSR